MKVDLVNLANSELSNLIDEWVKNVKYRQMLKSRYIDGLTYQELAEVYSLSVQQVKNIIYKQSAILFAHIDAGAG